MNSFINFPSTCSEQAHRLRRVIFTPDQWTRITDQLTERERLLNEAEKEKAIRIRRHLHSLEMTKNWPTSLENILARQRMDRKNRAEQDRKLRNAKAEAIAKEFAEEKERFLHNCDMELFALRDSTKDANSALIFVETLRQRNEQIKLNKDIESKENEIKKMDDDKVKQDANNFIKEMATLKKRNYLKEKKYRQELTDEIERRHNECLNERKIQIQTEEQDIKNMQEELELKKHIDQEIKKKASTIQKKNYELSLQMKNATKERQHLEEIDSERLRVAIENAKRDMSRIKKIHDEEEQKEKNQKIDRVYQLIKASLVSREAFETKILERDLARQEQSEIEKNKKLQKHKNLIIGEILEQEKEFRVKERLEKQEALEKVKIEYQNRLREEKELQHDNQIQAEKNKQFLLQRRHILQTQIDEKKTKDNEINEENKIFQIFANDQWKREDNEYDAYMDEMIKDSKKKHRPLYPLFKVREEYKKKHHLNQRPSMIELARHTRSRIPFGPSCPPLLEIRPCTVSSKKI